MAFDGLQRKQATLTITQEALSCLLFRKLLWSFSADLAGDLGLKNGGKFRWIVSCLRLRGNSSKYFNKYKVPSCYQLISLSFPCDLNLLVAFEESLFATSLFHWRAREAPAKRMYNTTPAAQTSTGGPTFRGLLEGQTIKRAMAAILIAPQSRGWTS